MNVRWAGFYRSGSTLLYQVLREIKNFSTYEIGPSAPAGAHISSTLNSSDKKIITVRDFRDIVASRWRIELSVKQRHHEVLERQMNKTELHFQLFKNRLQDQIEDLTIAKDANKNDDNFLILHYEKFFDNFDWMFQQLEEFLEITIDDKVGLAEKCSIDSNLKLIKGLKDFSECEFEDHHFHGDHISPDRGKSVWKKYIPEEFQDFITEELSCDLKNWGYGIEG